MKTRTAGLLVFLALQAVVGWVGCTVNSPIQQSYMTIAPNALTFNSPDTLHTLSLTHSCSCPITWNIVPIPANVPWLKVNTGLVGDTSAFPVVIDRSKLDSSVSTAMLQISTNDIYKTQQGQTYDTVRLTVFR